MCQSLSAVLQYTLGEIWGDIFGDELNGLPVSREARHACPAAVLGLCEAALHQLQPHLYELNHYLSSKFSNK